MVFPYKHIDVLRLGMVIPYKHIHKLRLGMVIPYKHIHEMLLIHEMSTTLLCKGKRLYLLTYKVSRYCFCTAVLTRQRYIYIHIDHSIELSSTCVQLNVRT